MRYKNRCYLVDVFLSESVLRTFKSCAAFGIACSTKVARCLYLRAKNRLRAELALSLRVARYSHFAQNFGQENFYAETVRI